MARPLPQPAVDRIRSMAARGFSIARIKEVTGFAYKTIKRQIDPIYRQRCNEECVVQYRDTVAKRQRGKKPDDMPVIRRSELTNGATVPSAAMLAEAKRRASARRSLTSVICGDPPPGCSALDRRYG